MTSSPATAERPEPSTRGDNPQSGWGVRRFIKPLFFVAVLGGAGYAFWRYPGEIEVAWRSIVGGKKKGNFTQPVETLGPGRPWDGALTLTTKAMEAMGVQAAEAKPQLEPIRLELLGMTEYISDTLTKVRPMFKGRVDKVHASIGQSVKKGEQLIELYSTELAEAKRSCEIERIQWLYDKNLLGIRESLLQSKTISQQLFDETKNNELKNRHEYEVARDKLLVYGLTEAEVERVEVEPGSQKARLTLRSPTDGMVINRDVAVGNLYDENDTLLVIAPLDRLWVWGNVFESDLDLVRLGQDWEIRFPFLNHKVRGKVEYISNRVDPSTHAVRVRTSIPNSEGKLKSDMLVRGMLEISPVEGRVVIPRTALIVGDGHAYVFVEGTRTPGRFVRRSVVVAQETDDRAIIAEGIGAGEKVVTVGALILAQMYEDLKSAGSGEATSASSEAD